jgi:tetratricopeptide (TPR) repeat protein
MSRQRHMLNTTLHARCDRRRFHRGAASLGLALAVVCAASTLRAQAGLAAAQPAPQSLPELEPAVADHIRSFEAAAADLVRAKATDARLAEAYGLLGQIYHAYSLAAEAEARYLTAHRLAPSDFRWPYLVGHLLQEENRADEALSFYDRARAIRADYAPLAVNVGILHLAQHRIEDAAAAFEAALAIDGSMAAARYGLGQVAMSRRDYARAVEHFSRVLTDVPDATRVHYALALAYRGLGQMDQATSHFGRQGPVGVRAADPLVDGLAELIKGARLSVLHGRLAFEAGRSAEAAEAFRKAVAAEPDSVPARVNLGSALGQLGDVDGAIEEFRSALEREGDNRAALYNLGTLYASRGRLDEAVAHLVRLLALTPEDHQARFTLGQQLRQMGRLEDARAAFAQVAGDVPDHEDAVLGLVDTLTALGRHREALEAVDKSHAQFPTKGRTMARLAYLLAAGAQPALRDPARALDLSRRVYGASGVIGHGAVVAMALAGLGRCQDAVAWQRDLIAKAAQQEPGLLAALRADLTRYETSCR